MELGGVLGDLEGIEGAFVDISGIERPFLSEVPSRGSK